MRTWTVPGALGVAGVAALAAIAVLAARTGEWASLAEGAAVPLAFLVAGGIGVAARPAQAGIRLLLVLGSGHLAAAALTGWAGVLQASAVLRWALGAAGDAAYLAGFAALAVLLACFPSGAPDSALRRRFVAAVLAADGLVLAQALLFRDHLPLTADIGAPILAPGPLPLVPTAFDLLPLALLTLPAAVVVLLVSVRRMADAERAATGWAVIAGTVLAVALVGSAVADATVPGTSDWAFPLVVGAVPFLLLAGLTRSRPSDVDLLVVRTVARGAVVVLVLATTGALAASLDSAGAAAAGALLTVAAVLLGRPVLDVLERLADRATTAGRVRREAVRREVRTLPADPAAAARIIADGLDAAWVRITTDAGAGIAGSPGAAAEQTVTMTTPEEQVGVLECGPRRGGWRPRDVALLLALADDLALRLRDVVLTGRLAEQVRALEASRVRIVQAEAAGRRRVERDLHDGAQQQIVALLARVALAREQVDPAAPVAGTLGTIDELARRTLSELRELVSGIAPPLLGDRGLLAAIESRVALLPIDVAVDADPRVVGERFAPEVEGAAYFVVAEALANVMKHSGSDRARVVLAPVDGGIRAAVIDEGDGGADAAGGGLSGLRDRVEGLGGRFVVAAVPGVGTTVSAELPGVAVRVDA